MFRELIDGLIERSGSDCIVRPRKGGAPYHIRAFITPMNDERKDFGGLTLSENGALDARRYRFVGKAENDLSQLPLGSSIECGGILYRVDSSEIYQFYGDSLYCRAVLRRSEGGEMLD